MPESGKVKIAKFLAECGLGSRRSCEKLIKAGKISVNGRIMRNVAERIDPGADVVEYSGRRLRRSRKATFALNKPPGYVSTMSDPKAGPTIAELIPPKYASLGLKPVGRLDRESEGLMILTNDGALANRLMHPRYGVPKIYRVRLDRPPDERILSALKRGVRLADGEVLQPMGVRRLSRGRESGRELELTLREGRKHEIRRAFATFGYEVQRLQRIAMGSFKLGSMRRGGMVELTGAQVRRLEESCGLSQNPE